MSFHHGMFAGGGSSFKDMSEDQSQTAFNHRALLTGRIGTMMLTDNPADYRLHQIRPPPPSAVEDNESVPEYERPEAARNGTRGDSTSSRCKSSFPQPPLPRADEAMSNARSKVTRKRRMPNTDDHSPAIKEKHGYPILCARSPSLQTGEGTQQHGQSKQPLQRVKYTPFAFEGPPMPGPPPYPQATFRALEQSSTQQKSAAPNHDVAFLQRPSKRRTDSVAEYEPLAEPISSMKFSPDEAEDTLDYNSDIFNQGREASRSSSQPPKKKMKMAHSSFGVAAPDQSNANGARYFVDLTDEHDEEEAQDGDDDAAQQEDGDEFTIKDDITEAPDDEAQENDQTEEHEDAQAQAQEGVERSAKREWRGVLGDAPSQNTEMAHTWGVVERCFFQPHHGIRRGVMKRHVHAGMSSKQMAHMSVWCRGLSTPDNIRRVDECLRHQTLNARAAPGGYPVTPATNYAGVPGGYDLAKPNARQHPITLVELGRGVVERPKGINRGEMTQAIEWCERNHDYESTIASIQTLSARHGFTWPTVMVNGVATPVTQIADWDERGVEQQKQEMRARGEKI